MKAVIVLLIGIILCIPTACDNVLDPTPVDLLVDNVVLNEPADVPNVEIGIYSAFRSVSAIKIIAGDLTADMLSFNGTFTQYRELGNKQITPANGSVAALWSSIYSTVYLCNFMLERLPEINGVRTLDRQKATGTAHLMRGLSYFIGLSTFGEIPKVTTTSIEVNRNTPRSPASEILELVESDLLAALENLPETPVNIAFAGKDAARAALARFSQFNENWQDAETYASAIIESGKYVLNSNYQDIVNTDFPSESIFEMGYSPFDDPGTNGTVGLNYLFVTRREIVPSNEAARNLLTSPLSGERRFNIKFEAKDQKGADNGFKVMKYGTKDADNNNVNVFRLGEMYLIRAEARAHLGKLSGSNSAQADVNVLRARADGPTLDPGVNYNVPLVGSISQDEMLSVIQFERYLELAYEGHRWYDLVRTGKANEVMSVFSPNWKQAYQRWPIPQHEINNNPGLKGQQNSGY